MVAHMKKPIRRDLQLQLGSPPVSPLGVVPNSIASSHPDPLWDGPVLFSFLGEDSLHPECFQGRHFSTLL